MSASLKDAASYGGETVIACAVVGETWQGVPSTEMACLRARMAAACSPTLSSGTLKQVDDQSLVALSALKQALEDAKLRPEETSSWGLVAAPRLLGRKRIAESLMKFREQGAWSVSPHIIPHCSLHSLPGLLSQGLRIHGPNIGAGGMPGSEAEAIWAAMTFLEGEHLPGIWIVLTGWDREAESPESSCQAVVVGLRRGHNHSSLPRLSFIPGGNPVHSETFSLESAGDAIRNRKDRRWDIGGAIAELTRTAANMEAAA